MTFLNKVSNFMRFCGSRRPAHSREDAETPQGAARPAPPQGGHGDGLSESARRRFSDVTEMRPRGPQRSEESTGSGSTSGHPSEQDPSKPSPSLNSLPADLQIRIGNLLWGHPI